MHLRACRTIGLAAAIGAALFLSREAISQSSQEPVILAPGGDVTPIHDPTMVREGPNYYLFSTNRFQRKDLPEFCSPDLHTFHFCGYVFDNVPGWTVAEVPNARDIWAPDIHYVNGEYRLYYAVSTFGSNRSVIGLITGKSANPMSPDYHWVDQGKVIGSTPRDDFNAIDPNLTIDADGRQWLAFGSYWSGIKLRLLDPATGKPSSQHKKLYSLASRPRDESQPGAIEAPSLIRHDQYYYLFVSWDQCCRGTQSTYRIMVGRSKKITGPYEDKAGKSMMRGNATELLAGNGRWRGPGGESVVQETDRDLLVFHAYDGRDGRRFLLISTLVWEDGWPRAGSLAEAGGDIPKTQR